MKLISAHIKGFRNIEDARIDLNDGITALIADNGFGKTNLIDALSFAVEFIRADEEHKDKMMTQVENIPMAHGRGRFAVELILAHSHENQEFLITYGYEFSWGCSNRSKNITKEWLSMKENEKSKRFTKLINREKTAHYKSSKTGRCSAELNVASNELVLNRLRYVQDLFYAETIRLLNHVNITVLKPDDTMTDLPRFLYHLKMKHPDRFQLLESETASVLDSIKGLNVYGIDPKSFNDGNAARCVDDYVPGKACFLSVDKAGYDQPIDYTCLSKGEIRVLYMLAKYVQAELRGDILIAIDEPENSIHPRQYSSFVQSIGPITMDERNVLIASQSPFLVQYITPKNYYIGVPGKYESASFSKIDRRQLSNIKRGAEDYEESVAVYIFDLLSGSRDEVECLVEYLEK